MWMCNENGKKLFGLTFAHAKISPGHKDKLTFLATPCKGLELADLLHISTLRFCVASVGFLIVVRLLTRFTTVVCCRGASKQTYRSSLANVVASQARNNCSAMAIAAAEGGPLSCTFAISVGQEHASALEGVRESSNEVSVARMQLFHPAGKLKAGSARRRDCNVSNGAKGCGEQASPLGQSS